MHPEFCAQVAADDASAAARGPAARAARVAVPVLQLTGPAALQQALDKYSRALTEMSLGRLREHHGESSLDPRTWDRVSLISRKVTHASPLSSLSRGAVASVTVLPYCFFRSRGCAHLVDRYKDRVIFHHEFDTGDGS